MRVVVEESPKLVFEFWELIFVWISLIKLAVVVQNVDSFFFEQLGDFWVAVDHLPEISFLEVWVKCLISQSDVEEDGWQQCVKLKAEAEVRELIEEEG